MVGAFPPWRCTWVRGLNTCAADAGGVEVLDGARTTVVGWGVGVTLLARAGVAATGAG